MSDKQACAALLDELAAIVDGDPAALARHAQHLGDCDDCRDARHGAAEAARTLGGAGADFVAPPPEELEQQLFARLDAAAAPAPTPAATPAPGPAPTAAPTRAAAAAPRRRSLWWFGAAAAAAAAAAGVLAFSHHRAGHGDDVSPAHAGGLSGKLVEISRAAADGLPGVKVGTRAIAAGMPIASGETVESDGRTRVKLVLADGTSLVLDHGTQVTLRGDALELRGQVAVDVSADAAQPVALLVPTGRVTMLGALAVVSAADDGTSVRVARGHAELRPHQGLATTVLPGEEGLMPRAGAGSVAPVSHVAESLAWSELEGGEPTEKSLAGLGELRAHKPGERADKERPLSLARHQVTVRVSGNVARTEIEESFKNDGADVLEGLYRFPLPPDARIDRLALFVGDRLEEGAIVERDHAAKIWRGVMHHAAPSQPVLPQELIWVPGRWHDPALLEWQSGGRFELKIYPIPAHGERKVILSYTQTIPPHGQLRRYVYPLAHSSDASTRVGHFELDARVSGADDARPVAVHGYPATVSKDGAVTRIAFAADDFVPAGDVLVDYALPKENAQLRWWTARAEPAAPADPKAKAPTPPKDESPAVTTARRELAADPRDFVVFALRPQIPAYHDDRPRDFVLAVDSSQSMVGERFARATELVTTLIAHLDRRDHFRLLACDVSCQTLDAEPRSPSSQAAAAAHKWLSELRPAGASDLVGALTAAAGSGSWPDGDDVRVLYIGDGIASVGPRRTAAIAAETAALTKGALRFTTVGIGGDADAATLGAIARAGRGQFVPYVPGERVGATALAVLETTYGASLGDITIELPAGLAAVAPTQPGTLRAGDEVLIAARYTGEVHGQLVLHGTVAGKPYVDRYPVDLTAAAAGNSFVPRLWAEQRIQELDLGGRGEDVAQVIALSKDFHVLSRRTSLLVLESEAMFRAFGIERETRAPSTDDEQSQAESGETSGTVDHPAPITGGLAGADSDVGTGAETVTTKSLRADAAGKGAKTTADGRDHAKEKGEGDALGRRDKAPMHHPAPQSAPTNPAMTRMSTNGIGVMGHGEGGGGFGPGGGGYWMKRVWFRVGSVMAGAPVNQQAVDQAQANLALNPDSRDRHRALVQALARAGQVDQALAAAETWLGRDQLDADAVVSVADLMGRRGDRAGSLRILSGIVDLAPDDRGLHERMAGAYERVGDSAHACAHRVSLAEIVGDAPVVGAAVRCERSLGRSDAAARLLAALPDGALRTRVEAAAAVPPLAPQVKGDLVLDATWGGASDLDLTLVSPSGTRISWMGGGKVSAEGVDAVGHERLALGRAAKGSYLVEVSRTRADDSAPVAGQINVTILGVRRSLPFTLTGAQVDAGRVDVVMRSKMVRLN